MTSIKGILSEKMIKLSMFVLLLQVKVLHFVNVLSKFESCITSKHFTVYFIVKN